MPVTGPSSNMAKTPHPCPSDTLPIFQIREQRLTSGKTQGAGLCPNAPDWASHGAGDVLGTARGPVWPQSHTGPPWATQKEAEREGGCEGLVSTPHPWGPLGADILVPRLKEQGAGRWKSER